MSDEFRRLLDDHSGTPLRAVLESGLRDRPSKRNLARAARSLGVGAAALGAAQSAAATEAAHALHASLWAGLAKWGAAGLLIGGAALSPLLLNSPSERLVKAAPRAARAVAVEPKAAPAAAALAIGARRPEPTLVIASAPVAAPVSGALPILDLESTTPIVGVPKPNTGAPPVGTFQSLAVTSSAPSAGAPAANLDSEVALLDSVRTALKRSDPRGALTLLDRHAQLATPSLGAEATLLRVQALVAAGRVSEAQAIARRASDGTSASAYAQRLSKLAGLPDRR